MPNIKISPINFTRKARKLLGWDDFAIVIHLYLIPIFVKSFPDDGISMRDGRMDTVEFAIALVGGVLVNGALINGVLVPGDLINGILIGVIDESLKSVPFVPVRNEQPKAAAVDESGP